MADDNDYRDHLYKQYSDQLPAWKRPDLEFYRTWTAAAIARTHGWMPADRSSKCLDLGCGPGNVLHMLKTLGFSNVTGVDISPDWEPQARKVCETVVIGDMCKFLASHENEFDLITGFDIIEHFRKDELVTLVKLIEGALRLGGRVILQTPNADSPWGCSLRYGDLTHELLFNPHSLTTLLKSCSLSNIESRPCGPYVHGVKSLVRVGLWNLIAHGLRLWNLIEMGTEGSGVYSRIFLISAQKTR